MKIYFLFESFAKDAKNMLLYIENLILVFSNKFAKFNFFNVSVNEAFGLT